MHKLRKKGWSEKELERLQRIQLESQKDRSVLQKFLDAYIFWLIMLAALLVNLLIAFVFIPLLMWLSGIKLFSVVAVIGLCFGLLFDNLLHHFDELSHRHYILLVGLVPAVAAILVMISSEAANYLVRLISLANVEHNSLLVGLVYGLSFVAPFAIKRSLTH